MTLKIRQALPADLAQIVAVVNHAFQLQHDILAGERTSDVEVRGLMKTSAFFVALKDQTIVGVVEIQANGTSAYLGMFAVDPRFQGSGITAPGIKQLHSHSS